MIERRISPRVHVSYVTVEVYSSDNHHGNGEISDICTLENLSESGMLLSGDYHYETGQSLRLTFLLPESLVIIRTKATVVHRKKFKRTNYVGVQFSNLSVSDKSLITHFINNYSESEIYG